jgi:hypothetical protein
MYYLLQKEFYERMELEYIAYCRNRPSIETVEEQLKEMIVKNSEPNYRLVGFLFAVYYNIAPLVTMSSSLNTIFASQLQEAWRFFPCQSLRKSCVG